MTESLREEIADVITCCIVQGEDNSSFIAEQILSLPSGLRAVRECEDCGATGGKVFYKSGQAHVDSIGKCPKCQGTGLISRDIPISEAVEIPRMIIDGTANLHGDTDNAWDILLPSGERVEVAS